jgi:UDP-N-acetylmuramyl pentapeptide phosphotransferase/UDP-N-acetylglucosamine-1-phosphate transferase
MPAMPTQPALSALAALAVSFACLWILLSPFGRRLMLDQPNERSLHHQPVPRSGGLAIAAGVAAGVLFADGHGFASGMGLALCIAGALAAVSLADDIYTLPTLLRLVVQLAAAGAFLAIEVGAGDPVFYAVLVLAIAWYANLYNFMDGSDGLAGGMAVIGFGAYAWGALQSGQGALAAASASIAGAAFAFLLVNFHPARLFMGDVGSVPLGFLAGALGVLGWRTGAWPLWFPLLVFAPFVCDATLTLLRRLLRGERVWIAHKEHYYQRLVRMGFGHRGVAWVEYVVMILCAAVALLARDAAEALQFAALGGAAAALAVAAVWVDLRWRRFLASAGAAP